ncbi:Transmembrane protein 63C [Rhizopus stolonifer]|uniref:Transmembrane protein 63C n=1 Tax=Rhizopus stolonifer TaxID=4846 RepID=A0A367KU10_RHIST|nr:Transmembrane protein 63C [Rhizopus stolonifer]
MATIETAYYVPTFLGLSTTFGISCAVSAVCIIAFEICKRLDSMKCLFSPRTQLRVNPVASQPNRLFAWITSVFDLKEKDFINKVGLDATMHVRFLRMVVHFLMVQSLMICPVLLSLHWTGSVSFDSSDLATEFATFAKNESSPSLFNNTNIDHFRSNSTLYYLSIANIPNQSPLVWVHVAFIYEVVLCWLWLLFVNHIHHIDLLQQQDRGSLLHERSVLITRVPHILRNQAALKQHFERAHVGTVECITLVSNTVIQLVESILSKRLKRIHALETLLIRMAKDQDKIDWQDWLRRIQKREAFHEQSQQVCLLLEEIQDMDKEVIRLRDQNRSPEYYMPTGAAFVTFR